MEEEHEPYMLRVIHNSHASGGMEHVHCVSSLFEFCTSFINAVCAISLSHSLTDAIEATEVIEAIAHIALQGPNLGRYHSTYGVPKAKPPNN